jgi:phage baseplate assembly protein W
MSSGPVALKYPFSISGGSVTSVSDPLEIIGSQVSFCLGTLVGERVMRPTWGLPRDEKYQETALFAMGADVELIMNEAVEAAFNRWFPKFEVRGVRVEFDKFNPTYVTVEVRYGEPRKATDAVAKVGVQMPDGTELFGNEGM